MAVDFVTLETALRDVWTGASIATIDHGTVSPVPVYVDDPDTEEVIERQFPSIAIQFVDLEPDFSVDHGEERDLVGEDLVSFPNTSTRRDASVWYRIVYAVHSYALDAYADRQLVQFIETRKRPRDSIVAGSETFWMFRGSLRTSHEKSMDQKIYHRIWQYEILADLDNPDTDEIVKRVHEVRFKTGFVKTRTFSEEQRLRNAGKFNRVEMGEQGGIAPCGQRQSLIPCDANGNPVSARDAEFVETRTFAFNDTDLWFPGS